MHCKKSIPFHDKHKWIKKDGKIFRVTMGSYDAAEVGKVVGLCILNILPCITDTNSTGLYRDNELFAVYNASGPRVERIKKKIIEVFKNSLKITTHPNLIQTDFLDIPLNLQTEKFWPYIKPGDRTLYINSKSNHPSSIKNQMINMIGKRLTRNSGNREKFEKATPTY